MQRGKDAVLRALAGIVLWLAVSGIVSWAAGMIFGEEYAGMHGTFLTGISSAVLIPVFFLLGKKWAVFRPFEKRRKNTLAAGILITAAAGLCGAVLSVGYGRITDALHLTDVFSNHTQEMLFSASLPIQTAVLGFLAPVCEELLFRGIVFGNMMKFLPEAAAVLGTSALFALCHGNPIQIFYAFPMALVLQLFYHLEKGMEAPVAMHICANLTSVLVEYYVH